MKKPYFLILIVSEILCMGANAAHRKSSESKKVTNTESEQMNPTSHLGANQAWTFDFEGQDTSRVHSIVGLLHRESLKKRFNLTNDDIQRILDEGKDMATLRNTSMPEYEVRLTHLVFQEMNEVKRKDFASFKQNFRGDFDKTHSDPEYDKDAREMIRNAVMKIAEAGSLYITNGHQKTMPAGAAACKLTMVENNLYLYVYKNFVEQNKGRPMDAIVRAYSRDPKMQEAFEGFHVEVMEAVDSTVSISEFNEENVEHSEYELHNWK